MSKSSKKKVKEKVADLSQPKPWIKMSIGVKVIAVVSVLMAVVTSLQTVPALGWLEGILWGLAFGVFIWAIFFGLLLFNRVVRR